MVQVHVGEPFFRTRGSQRTRLIWNQEKPGATPGCPTIYYYRQVAQTDEQRVEGATRLVQFQLWRPFRRFMRHWCNSKHDGLPNRERQGSTGMPHHFFKRELTRIWL
jgi:hypothetical protein